jgi:signal transduction histidine kinase
VQLTAYRIVQEALTNVVRHSSATAADVDLHRTGRGVEVSVEDSGGTVTRTKDGNGIRGMAERVAAIGGEFRAEPRPGGGFRVHARLPVALDGKGTP